MESERQTYQVHNILTWRSDAALIGEILRCAQGDRVGAGGRSFAALRVTGWGTQVDDYLGR